MAENNRFFGSVTIVLVRSLLTWRWAGLYLQESSGGNAAPRFDKDVVSDAISIGPLPSLLVSGFGCWLTDVVGQVPPGTTSPHRLLQSCLNNHASLRIRFCVQSLAWMAGPADTRFRPD
jgi:hypothetical protein